VPLTIRAYRERHPDVRVVLTPAHANDVVAQLHSSRISVGLVWDYDYAPQSQDPAFDRVELLADPLRIVLPAEHPAAGPGQVRAGADDRDAARGEQASQGLGAGRHADRTPPSADSTCPLAPHCWRLPCDHIR